MDPFSRFEHRNTGQSGLEHDNGCSDRAETAILILMT